MKKRTIEEVHDRDIGHRKFARFIDKAIAEGYEITNIRETNVMFKFDMDGYQMDFDKMNFKTQKKLDEMWGKRK
jgi:hypothetical protein